MRLSLSSSASEMRLSMRRIIEESIRALTGDERRLYLDLRSSKSLSICSDPEYADPIFLFTRLLKSSAAFWFSRSSFSRCSRLRFSSSPSEISLSRRFITEESTKDLTGAERQSYSLLRILNPSSISSVPVVTDPILAFTD